MSITLLTIFFLNLIQYINIRKKYVKNTFYNIPIHTIIHQTNNPKPKLNFASIPTTLYQECLTIDFHISTSKFLVNSLMEETYKKSNIT